jgi:molybdopterin synthase sulfur carrier subunit
MEAETPTCLRNVMFFLWLEAYSRLCRMPMKVKVKFFALVRELTGKREEVIDLDDDATVRTLLGKLVDEYGAKFRDYIFDPASKEPKGHIQFLMDGRNITLMQGLDTTLREGTSLAILPPVGGG